MLKPKGLVTRRGLLSAGLTGSAGLVLGACELPEAGRGTLDVLGLGERLTMGAQRLLGRNALATEFEVSERSPFFRGNGTVMPNTPVYQQILANDFADYRLLVDGLVERPLALSLEQVRALPSRTQTTRHDCVEGWSAIGTWTGAPLGPLLRQAGLRPQTRFIVFHCADDYGSSMGMPGTYYESIDLVDAFHPQTILAYGLNGERLPVLNGAPLRLRVERQLGYKHAKYIMRIEAASSLEPFGGGRGGFWPDRGYDWYAGI